MGGSTQLDQRSPEPRLIMTRLAKNRNRFMTMWGSGPRVGVPGSEVSVGNQDRRIETPDPLIAVLVEVPITRDKEPRIESRS